MDAANTRLVVKTICAVAVLAYAIYLLIGAQNYEHGFFFLGLGALAL